MWDMKPVNKIFHDKTSCFDREIILENEAKVKFRKVRKMVLRQTDTEQSIVEYPNRNIEQYDLLGYYNDELIASLWKDQNNEWHWTKRLFNMNKVYDLGVYHCEFSEIASDFIDKVKEWLHDEIVYIQDMYDDLAEEDIPVEYFQSTKLNFNGVKQSNDGVNLNFIERVGNSDLFGKTEQLNFKSLMIKFND